MQTSFRSEELMSELNLDSRPNFLGPGVEAGVSYIVSTTFTSPMLVLLQELAT